MTPEEFDTDWFAEKYVNLVEALVRRGVPEDIARHEARNALVMFMLWEDEEEPESWEK